MADTRGPQDHSAGTRYAAWFHELDAWTEYWDIYHPETQGRYYFGDGKGEPGLLTLLLPRERRPRVFVLWTEMALGITAPSAFEREVQVPETAAAVMEVDRLIGGMFSRHFGDPTAPAVAEDYLEALFRCATDTLPPATERDARIAADDWRKPTAGRHMIDADLMWFAWAFHLQAAELLDTDPTNRARRALQMAGIATGCPANFAWRAHRRTREEYRGKDAAAVKLLRDRGLVWASDFEAGAAEVHALFRIREWGHA